MRAPEELSLLGRGVTGGLGLWLLMYFGSLAGRQGQGSTEVRHAREAPRFLQSNTRSKSKTTRPPYGP